MKQKSTLPQDEAPSNAFTVLLNTHRRGIAGNECSTQLEAAIRAAIDTGAKSEVNVKVTIVPGMDDQVNITIQPTAKLPQQKLSGAIFWVDEGGKLVTSDPRQRELPIRAVIGFTESRKLKEWRKTLEWMSQSDFANFIEDHLEDVLTPSGQELLSIATDLEASSTGGFKGRVNLDNGSVRLSYQDEVETTVEIPRNLTLGIPLFEHGDRYKLGARLRFIISGGAVKFKLLFTNLQDAKDQEFERIVQEIEEKTSQPIYRGRLALPWG